jgi:hypothetical protein
MRKRLLAVAGSTLLLAWLGVAYAGPADDAGGAGAGTAGQSGLLGNNPLAGSTPSFGDQNPDSPALATTPREGDPDADTKGILGDEGADTKQSGDKP